MTNIVQSHLRMIGPNKLSIEQHHLAHHDVDRFCGNGTAQILQLRSNMTDVLKEVCFFLNIIVNKALRKM